VFSHCAADTTAVIDLGVDESRRLGHAWLGTEHLLLAFGQRRDLLPAAAAQLLPESGAMREALARVVSAPPPSTAAELLKTVGVDLDGVRAAVRQTFGDEAVERLSHRRVHQPWQPWRRPSRRCTSLLTGSRSMAPRLKQAFERAGHEADRRRQTTINPAALLIGMLEVHDALSTRLLRDLGVDLEQLLRALRKTVEPPGSVGSNPTPSPPRRPGQTLDLP
jgi:ATP-dependent Clp protease ATP-binding subunit ClpA